MFDRILTGAAIEEATTAVLEASIGAPTVAASAQRSCANSRGDILRQHFHIFDQS